MGSSRWPLTHGSESEQSNPVHKPGPQTLSGGPVVTFAGPLNTRPQRGDGTAKPLIESYSIRRPEMALLMTSC